MKFNVLVIAAMVIASVNAGGRKKGASGHRHNDDSMPRSGAPFGLKVYPLFPQKRPVHDSDTLQDLDHTNNKGDHDLAKHEVYEDPDCKILSRTLLDLQASIVDLSGEYHDNRSTIFELQIKMKNSEDEEHSEQRASQSLAHAAMQKIKLEAITLKGEYKRLWKNLLDAGCLVDFNYSLSPEEIGRLGVFLDEWIEPSDLVSLVKIIARQAFIAAATHTNPDPVQCNTLRDEWSRLKAAATQLERVDGRKQWVKHADNLDRAVSDGRTDLVFSAARAMSGNSSRSAAVTPLYNSDGIVQYDPTSILRVMQGHYGSLAADTTGHSLDLQYWHDRQPIQVSRDTPPSETVTFSTRISRGIRLLQPFCR
ncbi:hypothetical protein BASA61_001925 [Batrachochytrium salamandrivorans]|nr:hypothetical protein BASA61_001925 [Batrachochytrium salamandrivorans]